MGNVKAGRLVDPETEEDLSHVETSLASVGIKLRDSNSEFRNFGEVLDETAANWENYSSVQQRAIAVAFAGTRNQEKFLVLMEGYDEALKYAEISANSAGNALKKFAAYEESVAASQKAFQASFAEFSSSILNSDLIKGTFDAGSGILGFFAKLNESVGALPVAATALGGILGFKGMGVFGDNGNSNEYALYLRVA